jgi:chromosome segregation ATPase
LLVTLEESGDARVALEKSLAASENLSRDLQTSLASAHTLSAAQQASLTVLRSHVEDLENLNQALETQNKDTNGALELSKKLVVSLKEQLTVSQDERAELKTSLTASKMEIAELQTLLEKMHEQKNPLYDELKKIKNDYRDLIAKHETTINNNKKLLDENKKNRDSVSSLKGQLGALSNSLAAAEEKLSEATKQKEFLERRVVQLSKQVSKGKFREQTLKDANELLKKKKSEVLKDLKKIDDDNLELHAEVKHLNSKIEKLWEINDQLHEIVNPIEDKNLSLNDANSELQALQKISQTAFMDIVKEIRAHRLSEEGDSEQVLDKIEALANNAIRDDDSIKV